MDSSDLQSQRLDHLGIVARICNEIGLINTIDAQMGHQEHKVSIGQAVQAMVINRYPRSFGKVVHLCVHVGVEPLFVPPREPWRNGFIENFNGQAQQLLLNHDHFVTFAQLQKGVHGLETAVNTTHRLLALNGQTPAEYRVAHPAQRLPTDFDWHQRDLKLDCGSVAFIRLVRKSGRITLHADDKFDIDPELAWQYVFARVDVPTRALHIYHDGQLIKTFDF